MTILTGSWYCHAQQQLQQNNNKTRGQTIRIYTNNNTVNDSKKLLPPSSTATTTANNDRNNVNTNKWVNNTTSNLILPSIDEESNEFEECDNAYAAQQDVKEKFSVLNSDQWKKGTTLIFGDSMLLGLREAKLCRRKRSKGHIFQVKKLNIYNAIKFLIVRKSLIISLSILVPTAVHVKLKVWYTKNW